MHVVTHFSNFDKDIRRDWRNYVWRSRGGPDDSDDVYHRQCAMFELLSDTHRHKFFRRTIEDDFIINERIVKSFAFHYGLPEEEDRPLLWKVIMIIFVIATPSVV